MALTSILDPVFDPLLTVHPFFAIFSVSALVTVIITLVYKYTTDQKRMKELKDKLKSFQSKIKEMSKKDPEKALKMQSEMMSVNLEYMKHSFKSTFYTLIPVLLIFIWLGSNIAYYPIAPGQEFTVAAYFKEGHAPGAKLSSIPSLAINSPEQNISGGVARWTASGQEGEYKLTVEYNGEKYDTSVLITSGRKYLAPEKQIKDSKLEKIVIGNEKVYPIVFGNFKINWFWTYFLISIFLSIGLRKLLKVY